MRIKHKTSGIKVLLFTLIVPPKFVAKPFKEVASMRGKFVF